MKKPATRRPLTPRHHAYIDGVLAGKTGKQAAIDAGFSAASASSRALELNAHPEVIAALAKARAKARKAAEYDQQAAFQEFEDVIAFAKETGNANAYNKAVEARARLMGLLDKPNASIGISIEAALATARGRLLGAPRLFDAQDADVIDVAATESRSASDLDIFG